MQTKKTHLYDVSFFGAVKRIRTADLFLTKEVLCLLSYNSKVVKQLYCFKVLSGGTQVPKKRMLLIAKQSDRFLYQRTQ